ncbi:MAG: GNAT family N-acetyltransferase [Alcanivoracaceae bacterium]|nr:GNAT family N-acetyltransferase [Alcanivoracaceae bacterium]
MKYRIINTDVLNYLHDKIKIGIFKKLNQSDLILYQTLYMDAKLMEYVGEVLNKSAAIKYFDLTLKYMSKEPPTMILYVIRENNNNRRIGVVGIRWDQKTRDSVEIGVIVKSVEQRKGYAHDAKQCLMKYAFKYFQLNSIIAHCDDENAAANLANEKLGFSKIKTFIGKRKCLTVKWQMNKEWMFS